MALAFSQDQLNMLMNDYYGGYKQRETTKYGMKGAGAGRARVPVGTTSYVDPSYYKNNRDWRSIGDELSININSINDIRQLYDYFNKNYLGGGNKQSEEIPQGSSEPKELKPGDDGYTSEPTSNYNPGTGQYGTPQEGTPKQQYDYSGYDSNAISQQVKKSGQISTGFLNPAYGVDPEFAKTRFGDADLTGNLANGISATQLLQYFDSNSQDTLNEDQRRGKGGIYDKVAALAEAETPLDLQPLPDFGGPVGKMNIPPAMVGKAGNASGVRAKRSASRKARRASKGTWQLNRKNFGNSNSSPISIGGLNI